MAIRPEVGVLISHEAGAKMPEMATEGSAGYDLCSVESFNLHPGEYTKVRTGIRISMPQGLEAQIRPRSGLAAKHGVTVLNSPGTIDSDYRGEICILLINHGKIAFRIEPGMRIAQMVFSRVITADLTELESLDDSDRGEGGFGSTGTR